MPDLIFSKLFTVFLDVLIVLIKLAIILELFEDFAFLPRCRKDKAMPLMKDTKNLTLLEDISIKFNKRNYLISS